MHHDLDDLREELWRTNDVGSLLFGARSLRLIDNDSTRVLLGAAEVPYLRLSSTYAVLITTLRRLAYSPV